MPAKIPADGSFAGYVASCLDITIRKDEELRKNEFIGIISHELRTPLTSLTGFIQIMLAKLENMDRDYFETALNKANTQIKKMSKMVSDFIDISAVGPVSLNFSRESFQLDKLLEEVIDELSMVNSTHAIIFKSTCNLKVLADRSRISAVMYNLVGNAIKYAPYGSTIKIKCSKSEGGLLVSVSDEGPGIPNGELEKIFGLYYRSTISPTISGFGIGLFLCAQIIGKHTGKIWAENRPDKGATFSFFLPEFAV